MEYLGRGTHGECLARLRQFIDAGHVPNERKPTPKGRMAVLNVESIVVAAQRLEFAASVQHMPRVEPCAPGVVDSDDGGMAVVGVDLAAAQQNGLLVDPHSGICTMPEAHIREFAFQEMLAEQVIYSEPCRPQPATS